MFGFMNAPRNEILAEQTASPVDPRSTHSAYRKIIALPRRPRAAWPQKRAGGRICRQVAYAGHVPPPSDRRE